MVTKFLADGHQIFGRLSPNFRQMITNYQEYSISADGHKIFGRWSPIFPGMATIFCFLFFCFCTWSPITSSAVFWQIVTKYWSAGLLLFCKFKYWLQGHSKFLERWSQFYFSTYGLRSVRRGFNPPP